jgi:2'-5' RNA ligase
MRLFLAVFPPKEILESFEEIQGKLKRYTNSLRFIKPSIIHMTVRFLGGFVSDRSFELLVSSLSRDISNFEAFNVRIKEARFGFPGRKWPRILYVSIMKNEKMEGLVNSINSTLSRLNLEDIEEYKYRKDIFHFTLARTKGRLNRSIIANIRKNLEKIELWEGFRISSVALVESELKREGPVYKVVKEIRLK